MDKPAAAPQLAFETDPSRYRHWTLSVEGDIARLTMKVQPFGGQDEEAARHQTFPFCRSAS